MDERTRETERLGHWEPTELTDVEEVTEALIRVLSDLVILGREIPLVRIAAEHRLFPRADRL